MAVETSPRRTQAQRRNESADSPLNAGAESIAERGILDTSLARIDIHAVRSACREWISAAPANRRTAREERRVNTSA
jgi:hypothetical protein